MPVQVMVVDGDGWRSPSGLILPGFVLGQTMPTAETTGVEPGVTLTDWDGDEYDIWLPAGETPIDWDIEITDTGNAAVTTDTVTVDPTGPVTPAPNAKPVADFSSTTSGLNAHFTSTASDSDGEVVSYAWDFGDGNTSTQANPSHTYSQAGTFDVRLVVTDDDGAQSDAVTKSVTVNEPGQTDVLVEDGFNRTQTNGWGTAETGGPWQVLSNASWFSTSAGVGKIEVRPGMGAAVVRDVDAENVRVDATFSVDKNIEAAYVALIGRQVGNGNDRYYVRLRFQDDGGLRMHLLSPDATIGGTYVPDITVVPGQKYNLSIEVTGTSPTTLKGKVWRAGEVEPGWQRSGTNSYAALQTAGKVGVFGTLQAAAASRAPLTVSFDQFNATDPAGATTVTGPPYAPSGTSPGTGWA